MSTINDLIQPRDVEHLLRVLGRKTRRSTIVRRPDIYGETIAVSELLHLLMWLDDNPQHESISQQVRHYLKMHMRPEDYEAGPPVDHAGHIQQIVEKAHKNVENSTESEWAAMLMGALDEIAGLSHYYE